MRLSLLLAAIPAVLADKFIQSCSKTSIVVKDNLMSGRCWNTHGELICSQLDLNYCIRSDYGVLREDPNGVGPRYTDSCYDCSNEQQTTGFFIGGPSILHCNCRTGAGGITQSIIDLDTIISNQDGYLACARAVAKRFWECRE